MRRKQGKKKVLFPCFHLRFSSPSLSENSKRRRPKYPTCLNIDRWPTTDEKTEEQAASWRPSTLPCPLTGSCIIVIHIDTSVLLIASRKVDGSPSSVRRQYAMLFSVTYSECQVGGVLSRVDRRTSGVSVSICSCSSCSGAASEEV